HPPSLHRGGIAWEGQGPHLALQTLRAALAARGGRVFYGRPAVELLREGRRVVGVVVEGAPGGRVALRSRAVVLADGGFQADRALVNRHIAPDLFDRVRLRAAPTGGGDGIRMAEAAGAQLVNMNAFYGHLLAFDALHNDALWPYPILDPFLGH